MGPRRWGAIQWATALGLAAFVLFNGCQGTESRDQVEDTVETLSGKQPVDQMQDLKEELEIIHKQQTERYNQLQKRQ
jgi:hypothetical protein